jgi:hypothetical protein
MATRTLARAAVNETRDISFIVAAIHSKNQTGQKFLSSFKEKFGCDILDARVRNGSRKNHYDFDILIRFNTGEEAWKHVEHKSSSVFREIKCDEKYWATAVQFHNGKCTDYSISKTYARKFYDTYIGSDSLKKIWGITSPTPAFDLWFNHDCKVQQDPKTPFTRELKEKVKKARGCGSWSWDQKCKCGKCKNASLRDERGAVNLALEFTKEDEKKLIAEVLPIANKALEQKEYWLTICGNLDEGNFNLAWNPKFKIGEIKKVVIRRELDVWFDFTCSDGFTFSAHLRWGKGAGFSCLRVDLKDTPTSAVVDVEDDE